MKLASYQAKLIFGSYRTDQANDPETYVTAIAHLLSRYPADIGARLTDPKNGIAGKYKWLPTVSEVHEEADKLIEKERQAQYRANQLAEQWRLRDRVEAEDKAEPLEHRQKTAQRILRETKDAFHRRQGEPYNVFVPTFAPQYADMIKRGGRPGFSLEDKSRSGVWVPMSWLTSNKSGSPARWKQFTAEELLAKYSGSAHDQKE